MAFARSRSEVAGRVFSERRRNLAAYVLASTAWLSVRGIIGIPAHKPLGTTAAQLEFGWSFSPNIANTSCQDELTPARTCKFLGKISYLDLSGYYPNPQLADSHYLEGINNIRGDNSPERSILRFQIIKDRATPNNYSFRQYNWDPKDTRRDCHWDLLRWTDKLTYSQTHDCVSPVKDTIFSPPITLMPRMWDGRPWVKNGKSAVSQVAGGKQVCTGENTWRANVLGWEKFDEADAVIHVRTRQTVAWDSGPCNGDTRWQEDYYLIPELPVAGGDGAPAMVSTVGGNLDPAIPDHWDIIFKNWVTLPLPKAELSQSKDT